MPSRSDAVTLAIAGRTAIDQRTSSDAEPLEVNFELTSKDRVAAAWMRLVGTRVKWVFLPLVVVLLAPVIFDPSWLRLLGHLLTLLFFLLCIAVILVVIAILAKKHQPMRVRLDGRGVETSSRSIQVLINWDQFRSMRVFRSGFLLVGNNLFISVVIPKSAFPDPTSEGTFRSICSAHLPR
jgi:glucan phosphoethanolaminetransferase (alkaline phosphatase superfamily)